MPPHLDTLYANQNTDRKVDHMTSEVDVFKFLALRSPGVLVPAKSRWLYVRDSYYVSGESLLPPLSHNLPVQPAPGRDNTPGQHDVDLFSPASPSPIGRKLAELIFTQRAPAATIVSTIENQLVAGLIYGDNNTVQTPPIIVTLSTTSPVDMTQGMTLRYAGTRNTYLTGQLLHVLPGSVGDIGLSLTEALRRLGELLPRYAAMTATTADEMKDWQDRLLSDIRGVLQLSEETLLADLVFSQAGTYEATFAGDRRLLFDVLYGLYILRRRETVDLEPFITALALMHTLERLAISELLIRAIRASEAPANRADLLRTLDARIAEVDFTRGDAWEKLAAFDLLGPATPAELAATLAATPIIHPLIARLRHSFAPFNTLKPIGIGDLKVVKQTFLGYRKTSISHIETVLKGETKTRTHRSLDRSENSFALNSSTDTETTKDSQSTTRFELKNEAEDILKTDIGVTANTSFAYKGNPVIDASLSAGLAVSSSNSSSERNSKNFVNEVLSKAISRIQTKVASQRSQVQLNEVEQTSVHSFTNTAQGTGHISGSYLWLDKIYQGRIYNYGRRMMFEFILPEPAEFYVEARLQAYIAKLDIPKYPMPDNTGADPVMPVSSPAEITEAKYTELAQTYDLSSFPIPAATIDDVPLKTINGDLYFHKGITYDLLRPTVTEAFSAKIDGVPEGYELASARLTGSAEFAQRNEIGNSDIINTLDLALDGTLVFHRVDETQLEWEDINSLGSPSTIPGVALPEMTYHSIPSGVRLRPDVRLSIFTKTCLKHSIGINLDFRRSDALFADWQTRVYNEIYRLVMNSGAGTAAANLETRRINWRRAIDELKAQSMNEIIQGRSESWNDAQVRRELKRQCVTLIAREFDSDDSDDLLPGMPGMGVRSSEVDFPVFSIIEPKLEGDQVTSEARGSFADNDPAEVSFSAIVIDQAARRARLVQFLEQAFEWQQLSFMFYPYFWARMPKWLQLLERDDPADPQFTEFLQAGSARALLAVRPGYENAVLHFLATREPWSGGASPVIGDPLYLPLYEEIRARQDDLAGAEPVGAPWEFSIPTSLVYLESSEYPLPMEYPAQPVVPPAP